MTATAVPATSTSRRRGRVPVATAWLAGAVVAVVAAVVVAANVDTAALRATARAVAADPLGLSAALAAYGLAFAARAWAWRRLVPQLSLGHALAGIHLALGGNHVLPLRLGEPLRVASVTRRAGVRPSVAASSTIALRGADVVALAGLAAVLGWVVAARGPGAFVGVTALAGTVIAAGGVAWLARQRRRHGELRLPGLGVATVTAGAWLLEAVVLWQVSAWAGLDLSLPQAAFVTVVAVAGQVAAVAPGGFGTYEAAGTAAMVAVGVDPATGLAVVLAAHAVKTVYSLAAGAVALAVPSPGMLGRFRLPRERAPRPAAHAAAGPDAPVVLFMPAYNEETTVGAVVARVPDEVHGHPVRCLVIDDGSTDRTAEVAASAGATVVRSATNRGLGAAVRRGFAEASALGPAAVAFCDADGEYAPEELGRMAAPILTGDADYVVGSRFAGDIERMLPHRRFGNRVLTRWVAWTARAPITDGQSGYRALSPNAAAAADIVHDYNYAQVLTLDLVARGFRYAEVPISYRFRDHGRSFVRLGRYLAAVVPAVRRVVNRQPPEAPTG